MISSEFKAKNLIPWSYFDEYTCRIISFFLSKRLKGKNLDLGGGRTLYYPNSTVVDGSSAGIKYNPAKEKYCIDLSFTSPFEKINGHVYSEPLPFKDNSFATATAISFWQYVKNQSNILKELERVLVQGGEFYIIHPGATRSSQLGGMSFNCAQDIINDLNRWESEYETLVEILPISNDSWFESVCIAMPVIEKGKRISKIRDKEKRQSLDEEIRRDRRIFLREFKANKDNIFQPYTLEGSVYVG